MGRAKRFLELKSLVVPGPGKYPIPTFTENLIKKNLKKPAKIGYPSKIKETGKYGDIDIIESVASEETEN